MFWRLQIGNYRPLTPECISGCPLDLRNGKAGVS